MLPDKIVRVGHCNSTCVNVLLSKTTAEFSLGGQTDFRVAIATPVTSLVPPLHFHYSPSSPTFCPALLLKTTLPDVGPYVMVLLVSTVSSIVSMSSSGPDLCLQLCLLSQSPNLDYCLRNFS